MTSLLFISPELPFPAHSGGKLKSLKLVEHLSTCFEVTLCCPLKGEDTLHVDNFRALFPTIHLINNEVHVERGAMNLVRSYVRDEPLNVYRTASEALRKTVESVIEEFDVVFLDHYETGQFLPKDYSGAVIYHAHNAYYKIWETYSRTRNNPFYKLATRSEAKRVKNYEVSVANRADLVFAAPEDLLSLRNAGVTKPLMAETYHLGDYGDLSGPGPSWYETESTLVYMGSLGWEANTQGLLWFIKRVWPRLSAKYPKLKLKVIGKGADVRLLKAIEGHARIELLGFVEDLDEVFSKAHVCIAPLTFGSGMKVKVLSALSRGIPVVTTPIGAESIDACHREHLMISKNASAMFHDIDDLFCDETLWRRLAENSQNLIVKKYTWEHLFSSMDESMSAVGAVTRELPELAISA